MALLVFTPKKLKMEQGGSPRSFISIFLLFDLLLRVVGNAEVDALTALRLSLSDPFNALQSWNATAVTPCLWIHVTCNSEEKVVRVDLGNVNLSGQLVPQLGQLPNLQYFLMTGSFIAITLLEGYLRSLES